MSLLLSSDALDALVRGGAVALHWENTEGCCVGGESLVFILPPAPATEGSGSGGGADTLRPSVWAGAVLIARGWESSTSSTNANSGCNKSADGVVRVRWELSPAVVRLHPFVLPPLPRRVHRAVLDGGHFASFGGGGYGPHDVGVAAVDAAMAGGCGVALLRSGPVAARVEAISGSFPLFGAPHSSSGSSGKRKNIQNEKVDGDWASVLPPAAVGAADRQRLLHQHWAQLQPFLAEGLAERLTGGRVAAALESCLWCVLQYPHGDPFPLPLNSNKSSHNEGEGEGEDAAAMVGEEVVIAGSSSPRVVWRPARRYHLLPDFLLQRHAALCPGPRSTEPRWRPAAAAAAQEVRRLAARCLPGTEFKVTAAAADGAGGASPHCGSGGSGRALDLFCAASAL